ncbi:MAG: TetR/AcrR family transcriptional regulator [Anaerolineae bacterium]|nr:TetR/AcrR family transcriptional regulator [Anaerolineae bacterium]
MADTDPIREQLAAARRNQILDAAAQVFAAKGFHRATTREIAQAAGVSEGTIYNYFGGKADLPAGIVMRLADLESLDAELLEALRGDVRAFFVAMFRHRAHRIEQSEEMLRAILPEVLVNPDLRDRFRADFVLRIATLLEEYVRVRVAHGDLRPVDPELVTRGVQGMFVGLLVLRILGDETLIERWDEMPEVCATLLFDGLVPEGGRR